MANLKYVASTNLGYCDLTATQFFALWWMPTHPSVPEVCRAILCAGHADSPWETSWTTHLRDDQEIGKLPGLTDSGPVVMVG
jgi:hypothetical protein